MRILLSLLVVLGGLASEATATQTGTQGWEDGTTTVVGTYPVTPAGVLATNVGAPDPVYSGSRSLKLVDNAESGTPQAYIAWITGLQNGDQITASVWRYDTTLNAAPSCRLWGHWNDDPSDVDVYSGTADGNTDYGPGTGWDQTSYTWTVSDDHTGFVLEIRTYSNTGDTIWIDDLEVTIPDTATFKGGLTLVTLSDFAAESRSPDVNISWETVSEINSVGFHLWRGNAETGPYIRITTALIPSEGTPLSGAKYSYLDTGTESGNTYWYKLEDVDLSGKSTFHGPVIASPSFACGTMHNAGAINLSILFLLPALGILWQMARYRGE